MTGEARQNPRAEAQEETPPLILASASPVRLAILGAAGVTCRSVPADLDEAALRGAGNGNGNEKSLVRVAGQLAAHKAMAVSRRFPGDLVLGADQILVQEGRLFTKVGNRQDARTTLRALRGKTHTLISAVSAFRAETEIWNYTETARLHMREFSDTFLESYLDRAGESIFGSVGCYRVEDGGLQLFESIEGDHFTILGLPLLPVLGFLREQSVLKT